jgi:hypothetical protein
VSGGELAERAWQLRVGQIEYACQYEQRADEVKHDEP